MKRCPQCEFIYEDDQSLCDMDGVLLVLDSRTLPNLALATVDVPVEARMASKTLWRHRTFPAMAALILATVLSLVYFVSTQRGVQSVAPAAVDSITTTPVANQPAPVESNPAPPPPVVESAAIVNEEPKPGPAKARTPTATKKASAKTPTTQNRTVERKKEENKVGSILKKTGRILKKPFKL